MTIQKFHPVNLASLRAELAQAIAFIGERHGVDLQLQKISYNDHHLVTSIKGSVSGPAPLTPEAEAFRKYATRYDFNPDDLGRELYIHEQKYKVMGLNIHSPRFPIVVQRVADQKRFLVAPEIALAALLFTKR